MQITVTPYLNVADDLFRRWPGGMRPSDPLARIGEPWTFKATDSHDAAEQMFAVGNRARDLEGRDWPSDVRSMSVGDMIECQVPPCNEFPNGARCYLACASVGIGWEVVPEPANPIVELGGQDMHTSRPAEHDAVVSTWFTPGQWPTCRCGYAPRDNALLTAHWREHGFEIVDDHGSLVKRPVSVT